MSKDARKRIEEYFRAEGAGEPEELFRFRLSGRTRLWGVRDVGEKLRAQVPRQYANLLGGARGIRTPQAGDRDNRRVPRFSSW